MNWNKDKSQVVRNDAGTGQYEIRRMNGFIVYFKNNGFDDTAFGSSGYVYPNGKMLSHPFLFATIREAKIASEKHYEDHKYDLPLSLLLASC